MKRILLIALTALSLCSCSVLGSIAWNPEGLASAAGKAATAASISAPILIAAGASPLLGAIACCVGSLFFGYFNDSYFWVVNRTLGVSEAKEQLTIWSVTSTIAWAVGVIEVIILSFFM